MNVDRYLTDEAVRAAAGGARRSWEPPYPDHPNDDECGGERQCLDGAREQLRAALPGILAAHRCDVLRELPASLDGHEFRQYRDGGPPRCKCGAERAAIPYATKPHDEAVPDGR